jgi:hypothetical protein
MRQEATLQELMIRERVRTGYQSTITYKKCCHCDVLVTGAHSCPALDGRGERDLKRLRLFFLFVSLMERKEQKRNNIRRFRVLRRQ